MDADLRKPNLHRLFDVELDKGLADAASKSPLSLAKPTVLKSLAVVSAGRTTLHPTQIVNQYLPNTLAAFRDRLVLIDTPPALAAAEATLIAMAARNVLLVLDRTSRGSEEIERVLHELRRAKVNVLGIVVNRAKVPRSSAYDDYYLPIRPETPALGRPRQRRPAARANSRSRARREG
jgi:Mrp family chromosome partitioning ATPase